MRKKIFLIILLICIVAIPLYACENSTQLRTAYIREITSPGSDNYGVRITYAEDKRLNEKGTDIQVKFNNMGTIKIGKENQEKFEYKIKDYDEWFSLTAIFAEAEGKTGQENYEKYQDALTKTYLFEYQGDINITFRVVVGDIEENAQGTGEILVGSEPVSDNMTLKIK